MTDLLKLNLSNSFSRKAILKCSFENVCSADALSKENLGMWSLVLLLILLPIFNSTKCSCSPLQKKMYVYTYLRNMSGSFFSIDLHTKAFQLPFGFCFLGLNFLCFCHVFNFLKIKHRQLWEEIPASIHFNPDLSIPNVLGS